MKVDTRNLKTVNEYAKFKNVTTKAVYDWIKNGKVQCKIIGRMKFIVVE